MPRGTPWHTPDDEFTVILDDCSTTCNRSNFFHLLFRKYGTCAEESRERKKGDIKTKWEPGSRVDEIPRSLRGSVGLCLCSGTIERPCTLCSVRVSETGLKVQEPLLRIGDRGSASSGTRPRTFVHV